MADVASNLPTGLPSDAQDVEKIVADIRLAGKTAMAIEDVGTTRVDVPKATSVDERV